MFLFQEIKPTILFFDMFAKSLTLIDYSSHSHTKDAQTHSPLCLSALAAET